MLARVLSGGVSGIDGYVVRVEADVSRGLPSFSTVGLGDSAVREGRDRVASAIRNSGFKFPMERVTVNLAPADVRKEGAGFDLPIALGILAATGQVEARALERVVVMGELALDGSTRRVKGVLPMAVAAERAGLTGIIVPPANAREASAVGRLRVLPVASLGSAVRVLGGGEPDALPEDCARRPDAASRAEDLSDVRGQEHAKRALEVAAAGGHNLLMVGPPGVGKTMLARRMAAILPELTEEEALIVTTIHSVAGLLPEGAGLVTARPFRAPHHTVSAAGLIGGGSVPRPGEVSLAHAGVLFLDELPEFRRDALEALRQPVEEGRVTITRSMSTISFPSEFALVASMNPCPCGNLGHPRVPCRCTPTEIRRYLSKVSGPLLDRIDVRVSLGSPAFEELAGGPACDDTRGARERVLTARRVQEERARSAHPGPGGLAPVNARLHVAVLDEVVRMSAEARSVVRSAVGKLDLSARSYHKVLRVARTIADLAGAGAVAAEHVSEALQYRSDPGLSRAAGGHPRGS
ncbi:MAG: YifB family Mg chelatase-like AAA ATPase [Candidatus Eisenbacteria bacterium]|nr:YifB family Mg chelatase-like AAA ATPase [Candidatus Eisenbacteria bacterium]